MPKLMAALAIFAPMAPSPMTPSFLPSISVPANFFFSFSAAFATSGLSVCDFTHSIPPTTSRDANNIPQRTSSFTALELAPGVLKTTTPFFASSSRGILLTPAPALTTAKRLSENSMECISALLTKIPCASLISSVFVYPSPKWLRPTWAMGFKQ